MNEIYNYEYYHNYGETAYEDSTKWIEFFSMVANRIVEDIHPVTVLDAGCAMGYLVAALRDRGVESYGIDISEYAISKVREDIKPYCVVGSLTEPLPEALPQRYDLVVTIEVLEHLYAEDGKKVIENLCSLTDQILFSSTPDDFSDRTHLNVQQREYWARLFAEQGFYDDLGYRPTYLTYYATYFRRGGGWLRQVEDYERNIRMTENWIREEREQWKKTVEDKERHIQNQNAMLEQVRLECSGLTQRVADVETERDSLTVQLAEMDDTFQEEQAKLAHYKKHYAAAINQHEELKIQLAEVQYAYSVISNAACWKMTAPLRAVLDWLKCFPVFAMFVKGLKCLKDNGVRYTWKKVKGKLRQLQKYTSSDLPPLFTPEELKEQQTEHFKLNIKFSIITPLYNTPKAFLHDMIRSVQSQTYANWELCLADGSDMQHSDVERICQKYAKRDERIKYQKLEKNSGISVNTNACLEMATGDYIGLLDHDDLLHPAAMYEVMRAICEYGADFVYTDENKFHKTPRDAYLPHFKPSFAPDTLLANNYICHFSVFSRSLLNKTGKFDPACDGSQDHDMVLRLTEKAEKVVRIPEILYYWRAHTGSVAQEIGVKNYAIEAGIRAVEKSLQRRGLEGNVSTVLADSPFYRIRYALKGTPRISILIPNFEHLEDLRRCLFSVFEKTSYPNYEIVIVENNSSSPEVFEYYAKLQAEHSNLRVVEWPGKFNYSAINNYGARFCTGEYIILLNNDTEIITPDWIEEMLMFAQRSDVGAVGTMLYYPDNTVQHAGIILGLQSLAGHAFLHFRRGESGYMGRMFYAQNLSAVTAACMMIRRDVWDKVGGLDESFAVAFNDVDLCMRIRKSGYLIVWTPYAELYHYESKSRGRDDTPEKKKRFEDEVRRFQQRWRRELAAGDPYYNPNLTLERCDFAIRRRTCH